jgi:topoisomerase IV subunit A
LHQIFINADKMLVETTKNHGEDRIVTLSGMYKDYFLDYASYVILERAVPAIGDGLKPVQRRILHSMKEMDDGRYHKVANIIGQTMQYHPHGDAAIGEALVNLGQKNLLIDPQGNWGDPRTGDSAAAARYIEARLTKFALDVAFNGDTTAWQVSYDGRKKEPIGLPMKFPLLLAQGVEGIAVGLSTKVMPHNFIELIKESIKVLKGKTPELYPDFDAGGFVDVREYNDGKRGGKIRVRAKIEKIDNKTLVVKELPYGVTTETLINSILSANDKGKIKVKKVVDNTAKEVEVSIELQAGVSPDVTIDALYAFSDCEISISPNACIIIDNKPHFLTVSEILRINTENTKNLLKWELEIKQEDLEEKWHFASLEKIFIENRIYHEIEECETWEAVLQTIDTALQRYVITPSMVKQPNDKRIALMRDVTVEDITRLTEIRIKRISKYNKFAADELLTNLEKEIEETKHHLANLTDFTIAYYEELLKKYGKGRERKTEIVTFDNIQASKVVANNAKLYVNRVDGFVGTGLKKDEFVCDCSDIDDVIVFRKDGKFQVIRISDKTFVGKDIIHIAVWNKNDERTTYNMVYVDGKEGVTMVKRFNVTAITRDKEYDLTKGNPSSKTLYFSANPNGEAEIVNVKLSQGCKAKIKSFDYDFSEIEIKGRSSQGNILTRYPVTKIAQKEAGKSTLGARKIYFDEVVGRLNNDGRGQLLGEFDTGDSILLLLNDGTYQLTDFELSNHYDVKTMLHIGKFDSEQVISAVYFDGNKGWTMVKRFKIETSKLNEKFSYITDHKNSKMLFVTAKETARIQYSMKINGKKMTGELEVTEFVDVKGWKAAGNKVTDQLLLSVKEIEVSAITAIKEAKEAELKTGDSIELEINSGTQGELF